MRISDEDVIPQDDKLSHSHDSIGYGTRDSKRVADEREIQDLKKQREHCLSSQFLFLSRIFCRI